MKKNLLKDVVRNYRAYKDDSTMLYARVERTLATAETEVFLVPVGSRGKPPDGTNYLIGTRAIEEVMAALEQNGLHCNERGKVKAVIHYADRDCFIEAPDLTEADFVPIQEEG